MAREELNSDRLNYLIWQYLQESGYRNAAVTLQSEWQCQEPQTLDFASHVQPRALVSVVQRGLLYNEAERKASQARRDRPAVPGFFGPVAPLSPPPQTAYENALKRAGEQRSKGDAAEALAKRPKIRPVYELPMDGGAMEVDEVANGNNEHAYPSPQEAEEPVPMVLTDGPARSTQVEKVTELTSDTMFLNLTDSNAAAAARSPVLLHCEWNPRDATILAAAGTDALARLWTLSRGASHSESEGDAPGHVHVNGNTTTPPPSRNIMDETIAPNSMVTALSWTSDGWSIAVATNAEDGEPAKITVWGTDTSKRFQFDDLEPPVLALRWSPKNNFLLALVSDDQRSVVQRFTPEQCLSDAQLLPDGMQALDAAWVNDTDFVVCGTNFLWEYSCEAGPISLVREYETQSDSQIISVKADIRSRLIATSSENGLLSVWNHGGERKSVMAHDGTIIALAWQPLPNNALEDTERLVATCGEDGMLSVWNAKGDLRKPKCSMTMEGAVVAMAFTPDGAFIAGATRNQILIWRLEDTTTPRARWIRGSEPGWQSPKLGTDVLQEEDIHCLCWDSDGQKLAFGVNNQLAVIRWRSFNDTSGT